MAEPEPTPQALIEGVRADFDPDGTLHDDRSIEVKVNYSEVVEYRFEPAEIENADEIEELAEQYDPGDLIDTEWLNGAYARLRYEVNEEGTAHLTEFKDPSPSDGNWASLEFLRVIHAADGVVANVPGVKDVVPAIDVIDSHITDGYTAEIRRA